MKPKLKPCPFCGSHRIRITRDLDARPEIETPFVAINCGNRRCPVTPVTTGDTEKEAVARWNTRAPEAA